MDRGAVVGATGATLVVTGAPAADGRKGASVVLPPLQPGRSGTAVAAVTDLDLSGGKVAAVFDLSADFGGSQLARYDAARGWTTLGVSTDGGAAIGHRAFYAPTFTGGGVRAFYDGAEDLPGYAGRWTTGSKPVREVRAAKLGNPVLLTSAAFLGDRLAVFGYEDRCDLDGCQLTSAGPFPVG
jgi:hypothetical protein